MKALTIPQPAASLIAIGYTRVEVRAWYTDYRGLLAVHAGIDRQYITRAKRTPLREALAAAGLDPDRMPFRSVVAIAQLIDCVPADTYSFRDADIAAHGGFPRGYYVWRFDGVERIEPIPARGYLKLWDWQRQPASPVLFE